MRHSNIANYWQPNQPTADKSYNNRSQTWDGRKLKEWVTLMWGDDDAAIWRALKGQHSTRSFWVPDGRLIGNDYISKHKLRRRGLFLDPCLEFMVKRLVLLGFGRLPIELVHIIFTFEAQSRHTCLDLCLVASWARQIALPHLFRTLVAKDHGANFRKYLADPPYVPFNTNINAVSLVENVWMPLEEYGTTNSVLDVFETGHNIAHMALTMHCFYKLIRAIYSSLLPLEHVKRRVSDPALDSHRDLHLTILGATSFNWAFREFWHSSASIMSPLFDRITYIRVETVNSYKIPRQKLPHFSRLSHLSVPYYNSLQHIAKHWTTSLN